ncbi:MAG: fibronectin type III domain-containing protein [Candidatus Pacebacteria bacterium]|nr:fibronectin type III domain-containing protein [Candidatus Paceibacterota bacterium]
MANKKLILLITLTIFIFPFSKKALAGEFFLENSNVVYVFEATDKTFDLSYILNKKTNYRFDFEKRNKIWELELKNDVSSKKEFKYNPSSPSTYILNVSQSSDNKSLNISWSDFTFDDKNKFNINAQIKLVGDKTEWSLLDVTSYAPDYLIHRFHFPIINASPLQNDVLTLPNLAGKITHSPMTISEVLLRAPGYYLATASMQFFSYYDDVSKNILYLSTKDAEGYNKEYRVGPNSDKKSLDFKFINIPENNGTFNNDFSGKYVTEVSVMEGDWYDASKYYSSWALNQKFVSRGKLQFRAPQSLKDAAFWIISSYCYTTECETGPLSDENTMGIAEGGKMWKDFIGLKQEDSFVGMSRIYNVGPEEIFPYVTTPNSKLKDAIAKAKTYNGYIGPYWLPGKYIYQSNKYNQNNIDQYALKSLDGKIVTTPSPEDWAPGKEMAEINLYHDYIRNETLDRLSEKRAEDNWDGIYYDVISGETTDDYNENLPTQGGGNYDVKGHMKFMEETRARFPNIFISSEYASEDHINQVDFSQWNFIGNLNTDGDDFFMLPIYQTVYNQYQLQTTSSLIDPLRDKSMEEFGYYIWAIPAVTGALPGLVSWGDTPFIPDHPENIAEARPLFQYIGKIIKNFVDFKDYLKWGEKIRPLNLTVSKTSKENIWSLTDYFPKFYSNDPLYIDKILNSVWRAEDGSLGIYLINWSKNKEDFSFRFNFSDYGLKNGTTYYLYDMEGQNSTYKLSVSGDFSLADSMAARSFKMIKISTTPPPPPSAPSNLSATTLSSSEINLEWQDNATTEAGFTIQISTNGLLFNDHKSVGTNISSEKISGLDSNEKYYFRVRSYNSNNSSSYSNTASAKTFKITTPPQPTPPVPPTPPQTFPPISTRPTEKIGFWTSFISLLERIILFFVNLF